MAAFIAVAFITFVYIFMSTRKKRTCFDFYKEKVNESYNGTVREIKISIQKTYYIVVGEKAFGGFKNNKIIDFSFYTYYYEKDSIYVFNKIELGDSIYKEPGSWNFKIIKRNGSAIECNMYEDCCRLDSSGCDQ